MDNEVGSAAGQGEARARRVIDRCSRCGHCRELLEDSACFFMPRLFALADREAAGGAAITPREMRDLLALCTGCAICPCAFVHTWINEARDAFAQSDGLSRPVRLLENVQRLGRLGGVAPRLANAVVGGCLAPVLKRAVGVHPDRRLPRFPRDNFDTWAKARGLLREPVTSGRKVAYFVGCTARYFFPEVARASVEVLERNGVAVYVPEQKCCGMPAMQEGDRPFTFALARHNVAELMRCVEAGYDIVCSCPSCGYLFKTVLREGAEYSDDYRACVAEASQQAQGDMHAVSQLLASRDAAFTGRANRRAEHGRQGWLLGMVSMKVFADQGYFASLAGLARLRVANHCYDLGEYLGELHAAGELDVGFTALDSRLAYFAPCHQRQQGIGRPWQTLLGLIPEARVDAVGDAFDCCGQSGVMGFKKDHHDQSLRIAARLLDKVREQAPQRLLTDCLSCRLQFEQTLPYPVAHPVEILRAAYGDAARSVDAP